MPAFGQSLDTTLYSPNLARSWASSLCAQARIRNLVRFPACVEDEGIVLSSLKGCLAFTAAATLRVAAHMN